MTGFYRGKRKENQKTIKTMTLKEFKDYIESLPEKHKFGYGISNPFSWRGSYDEVAFSITDRPTYKEDILDKINSAYMNIFEGYKGGQYRYSDNTPIHFEDNIGDWTDGRYCSEKIAEIEGSDIYQSQEERLVKLAFQ